MKVNICVIQPKTFTLAEESKNVERALRYVDQAIDKGAKIVCFPEMYPGPAHPANEHSSQALAEKAKKHGLYIIKGRIQKEQDGAKPRHSVCADVIGPDGKTLGTYRRTEPMTGHVYRDVPAWNFDYQQFGDLPVFDTEYGRIGVLICSEVYAPELARILALKGAEIVFFPAGALINELMPTWKNQVWARAIENLMYTGACQNLYGVEEGVAMLCSPEAVLVEDRGEAVLVAEADLDRVRWLRDSEQKVEIPKQYKVVPGLLRWRRPDVFRKNWPDW